MLSNLKTRLRKEESKVVTNCDQLKMKAIILAELTAKFGKGYNAVKNKAIVATVSQQLS